VIVGFRHPDYGSDAGGGIRDVLFYAAAGLNSTTASVEKDRFCFKGKRVLLSHLAREIEDHLGEDHDNNHHDGIAQEKGLACPVDVGHGSVSGGHPLHHEEQEPSEFSISPCKGKRTSPFFLV
jgi:hypothetical protein